MSSQLIRRNKKGQFLKGTSGNPDGRVSTDNTKLLLRSIERAEKITGKSIISHYIERAYVSNRVIISVLNKLIPNKKASDNKEGDQPEEIVVYFQSNRTVEEEEFLEVWNSYKDKRS